MTAQEDPAVSNFRKYLRINTMHPKPDYDAANAYLTEQAKELGLPYKIVRVHEDPPKDVFVMTWEGTEPSLPSVMLNSHTDVVPVFLEHWKYPPFSAHKEDNGDIYARGTQDMKSCGIWYIEAIRRLKKEGKRFARTMHLTFVPDEEIGGFLGMGKFIEHEEFKKLNVGFGLDEGLANPTDAYTVFYGERCVWWAMVKCTGNPGHGSRFIENNAAEKIRKVINSFLAFRDEQEKKWKTETKCTLGDVTTVNLTKLEGGIQHNVVPAELSAGFDIRIPPSVDLVAFEAQLAGWCAAAGEGVTYSFLQKGMDQSLTPITKDDPWWKAFTSACEDMSMKLEPEIFPAGTDSRFLREMGLPAIGFSAMNNTPILLHDHNELLNEKVFLKGIDIYCKILPAVASVPKF